MLALEDSLTGVRDPQDHEGGRREVFIPQKSEALRTIAMSQAPSPFHFTFRRHWIKISSLPLKPWASLHAEDSWKTSEAKALACSRKLHEANSLQLDQRLRLHVVWVLCCSNRGHQTNELLQTFLSPYFRVSLIPPCLPKLAFSQAQSLGLGADISRNRPSLKFPTRSLGLAQRSELTGSFPRP